MTNLTQKFETSKLELPEGVTQPYAKTKLPSFSELAQLKAEEIYPPVLEDVISKIYELAASAIPFSMGSEISQSLQNIYRLKNGNEVLFAGSQAYLRDPAAAAITPEQAASENTTGTWRKFKDNLENVRQADGKIISYNLVSGTLDITQPGNNPSSVPFANLDRQSAAFQNLAEVLQIAERRGLSNLPAYPDAARVQNNPTMGLSAVPAP